MIDTVVFTQMMAPKDLNGKFLVAWVRTKRTIVTTGKEKHQQVTLRHKQTGLRIKFRPKLLPKVEVSLPKVLFGINGRMIDSQASLDRALKAVNALIKQVANVARPEPHFHRVDLVWQFIGNHNLLIGTHEHLLHPFIRKPALNYHQESLLWKGDGLSIQMYDKGLREKIELMTGKVTRIEVRLKKKKLKQSLGKGYRVQRLNFSECYQAYRSIICGFSPAPVYRISKEFDLLYFAASEKWTIHDRPALDFLFRDLSTSRQRKKLRDVQRIRLEAYGLNWRKILPEDKPPKIKRVNDYDGTPCHSDRSPRTP